MYGAIPASSSRLVTFTAGATGAWKIERITPVRGDSVSAASRLSVDVGPVAAQSRPGAWGLRGVVSNMRYTTANEARGLTNRQAGLDRPEAVCAALIPISKSAEWWAMAQDERRQVYEEISGHTTVGMTYLPQIARRLHHGRDLGEPFDFLTWFEFAPAHEAAFDELLVKLRSSEEWRFVEREVDIRLRRDPPGRSS